MEKTDNMKLRLILMGCILMALGAILLVRNGFSAPLAAIPIVGIVLLAVGIVLKPRKKVEKPP